jgi:hypothetical protein
MTENLLLVGDNGKPAEGLAECLCLCLAALESDAASTEVLVPERRFPENEEDDAVDEEEEVE